MEYKIFNFILDNLTDSLTDNLIDSLTDNLTDSLTDNLTDSLTDNLTDSLTDNLTDSLTDNLTDSLTDNLTDTNLITVLSQIKDIENSYLQYREVGAEFELDETIIYIITRYIKTIYEKYYKRNFSIKLYVDLLYDHVFIPVINIIKTEIIQKFEQKLITKNEMDIGIAIITICINEILLFRKISYDIAELSELISYYIMDKDIAYNQIMHLFGEPINLLIKKCKTGETIEEKKLCRDIYKIHFVTLIYGLAIYPMHNYHRREILPGTFLYNVSNTFVGSTLRVVDPLNILSLIDTIPIFNQIFITMAKNYIKKIIAITNFEKLDRKLLEEQILAIEAYDVKYDQISVYTTQLYSTSEKHSIVVCRYLAQLIWKIAVNSQLKKI